MRPKVFIQTNERQWLGALVSQYSLKRNSTHADAFDVEIMHVRDYPFLAAREGQTFLRGGSWRVWRMDDLQSFTPLRFMPPRLMGYQGRALVIDPDIFAVRDVWELLDRDMAGHGVMGRYRSDKETKTAHIATSVMLLDCAKLRHWDAEQAFADLFDGRLDYKDWIVLGHEDPANVGVLEDYWNDFDRLNAETRLLHNTKRRTQPWKTGLPVDFIPADKVGHLPVLKHLDRLRVRCFGEYGLLGRYRAHPDPAQERFFFDLLHECLEAGVVTEADVRDEIRRQHVRPDALDLAATAGSGRR